MSEKICYFSRIMHVFSVSFACSNYPNLMFQIGSYCFIRIQILWLSQCPLVVPLSLQGKHHHLRRHQCLQVNQQDLVPQVDFVVEMVVFLQLLVFWQNIMTGKIVVPIE